MQAVHQARPHWTLELMTGGEGALADAARELGITASVLPMPPALGRLGDAGVGGSAGDRVSGFGVARRLSVSVPQIAVYVAKLRRFIGARAPDVIHSNGLKTHILAAWASPRRSKIIWHVRDYVSSRPVMSRLMRIHFHHCNVAIATSHSVARDLDGVCRSGLRIQTVYNAIDLERFNPTGPVLDIDAISGLPPVPAGTLRVGLMATMARWKGQQVFLRALSLLPCASAIRGYVIGAPIYQTDGSQYTLEELHNLARELNLEQRVGFTGFVNDPAAAIRALDMVVHASTRPEPFGRVVAEAMACGKPVVASRAGGVTEIISEDENALGHPPGDAAALAGCIARLAQDCGLRASLGRHGRRAAKERFDPSLLAREVLPIYCSLVASHN